MEYIVTKYGFVEVNNDEVNLEYNEMRTSFIMQYASELLGEYATMPQLKSESQEDITSLIYILWINPKYMNRRMTKELRL